MAKKTAKKTTEKTTKQASESGAPHRVVEAAIFAAAAPVDKKTLSAMLPASDQGLIDTIITDLQEHYAARGVQLLASKEGFYFRTAPDLAPFLTSFRVELKKLSRAAMESLAVIAYHQPITRAEIETIRGVALSKGTLDILFDTGWIKFKGRRKTLGNPITLGTTDQFLVDFDLTSLQQLPGVEELKAMGLLHLGHDLSSIGMEDEEELSRGEQLDLLQSSLDDILHSDESATEDTGNELLMDEPTDDGVAGDKKQKKKITRCKA